MSNENVNKGTWSMCPHYDMNAPEGKRCKPDGSVCPVDGNASECDEDYIKEDLKQAAINQLNQITDIEAAEDKAKLENLRRECALFIFTKPTQGTQE